jgi:UTP--glucose-1-phosphate uridylyltransferase
MPAAHAMQVNPRDSDSAPVFQLETAMGSAIECFESAGAIVVPRTRFAPVKTCNDLFVLRSDAYKVLSALRMHLKQASLSARPHMSHSDADVATACNC